MNLRPRAYHPGDLPSVVELINHCELGGEATATPKSLASLQVELGAPRIDRNHGVCVWTADSGEFRAFARLGIDPVDGELHGRLHYAIRRSEDVALEREITAWACARMRAAGAGLRVRLIHSVDAQDPQRGTRLEALGFAPYRSFYQLARDLHPLPSQADLLPGYTIRPCRGPADAQDYVEVFNNSFVDSFAFTPLTVEEFLHDTTSASYSPEHDLVGVGPEGKLAAFCFVQIDAEWPEVGHVLSLGVLRDRRKVGLGRAMLIAGLHRLAADGAKRVYLFVDASSPTGATSLYRKLGFQLIYEQVRYQLDGAGIAALAS
jgi:ribosomal protein S18 acetylase RimI-like enzyme